PADIDERLACKEITNQMSGIQSGYLAILPMKMLMNLIFFRNAARQNHHSIILHWLRNQTTFYKLSHANSNKMLFLALKNRSALVQEEEQRSAGWGGERYDEGYGLKREPVPLSRIIGNLDGSENCYARRKCASWRILSSLKIIGIIMPAHVLVIIK
ncbi:unnamed protein product, partial [Nesidiocoris tenuis]